MNKPTGTTTFYGIVMPHCYEGHWFTPYYRKLISICFLLVGIFLVGEHIYMYGGFDFEDFCGHEWYGLIAIILGILIALRYKGKYVLSTQYLK